MAAWRIRAAQLNSSLPAPNWDTFYGPATCEYFKNWRGELNKSSVGAIKTKKNFSHQVNHTLHKSPVTSLVSYLMRFVPASEAQTSHASCSEHLCPQLYTPHVESSGQEPLYLFFEPCKLEKNCTFFSPQKHLQEFFKALSLPAPSKSCNQ